MTPDEIANTVEFYVEIPFTITELVYPGEEDYDILPPYEGEVTDG